MHVILQSLGFFNIHPRRVDRCWQAPGQASELLPAGVDLRFPTLIYVYSHVDPESDGTDEESFWVTQFLITDFGFSHQSFASHKYSD